MKDCITESSRYTSFTWRRDRRDFVGRVRVPADVTVASIDCQGDVLIRWHPAHENLFRKMKTPPFDKYSPFSTSADARSIGQVITGRVTRPGPSSPGEVGPEDELPSGAKTKHEDAVSKQTPWI